MGGVAGPARVENGNKNTTLAKWPREARSTSDTIELKTPQWPRRLDCRDQGSTSHIYI